MRDGKFKRFAVFVVSILSIAFCVGITLQSGNVDKDTKILNVVFLAGMILFILISWVSGIRKIRKINRGFRKGYEDLAEMEKLGRADLESFQFGESYLKERYEEYARYVKGHGDTDIREFINEYDIGTYAGKKFLEVIPDILTSAGILGTFIGLVVGLKEFDPSGYQQMAESMRPLIDGIKVAFLTSIYGIALSLSYSMMLSNLMGELEEALETFLEKYYFLQKRKKEPYHELIVGQQQQTQVIRDWTETFSIQLADRLEDVMRPTFAQLEEQLGEMADHQEEALIRAGEKSAEQFGKTFLESLSKMNAPLEKIEELQLQYIKALELSAQKLDSSADEGQEALQKVIGDIKSCFIDCAQILHENIERQTKAVEDYGVIAKQAGDSLGANSQNLNEQIQNLGKNIDGFARGIADTSGEMRNSSKEMQGVFDGLKDVSARMGDVSEGIKEAAGFMQSAAGNMNGSAAEVQKYSDAIRQTMQATSASTVEIGRTAQEFLDTMSRMQTLLQEMPKALEEYKTNAAAMEEAASKEAAAAAEEQDVWGGLYGWDVRSEQKTQLEGDIQKELDVLKECFEQDEKSARKDREEQKELMRELIKEVKTLSELEQKRQERRFFNRIFRRR